MDSLPDLVWRVLLEKGAETQMKYDTWLSDAMPKPRRKFVGEDRVWDDLREATLEALKRLRVQMVEEAKHYSPPGPLISRRVFDERENW